jgi:alpha-N-arabinofuranosidase
MPNPVRRRFHAPAVVGAACLLASVLGAGGLPVASGQAAAVPARSASPELLLGGRALGPVSRYLFGANVLWAFDAEGAFDSNSGQWYPGFVSLLRRLGVSALRYPAGTTSDSFHWLRAIGPEADRLPNEPYGMQAAKLSGVCCVLDGPAPSTVGPDEFGELLDQTGAIGNIVVNFATGSMAEAAGFVAYMTAPLRGPSSNPHEPGYWAALRAANGHPAPYRARYFEVGNEQSFPGQYGWRSGAFVSFGPHARPCPAGQVATCLYAFGGTTAFKDQPVGTFADDLPAASYSLGTPNQVFYVYFPPVAPGSATVYVAGRPWAQVRSFAGAGPQARVYVFDPATGAIRFGNGADGEIPPAGDLVSASYESGPHAGFVEFYKAMKAMDPGAQICQAEEANVAFLQLMGRSFPYDCIELHLYARPTDITAPITTYEERLMAYPLREAATLAKLQREAFKYSGRHVPVVVTEYGQLVRPMPVADPQFNLSLDEGLLIAVQLMEWARHGVGLAEKYLAVSSAFGHPEQVEGLSVDSAMIAGSHARFVAEPSGLALGLLSRFAGDELLSTSVIGTTEMAPGSPELWPLAAVSPGGQIKLAVVNANPVKSQRVLVNLGWPHGRHVRASVLDGPTSLAYNTPTWPGLVSVKSYSRTVGSGRFWWRFPAHSLTLLTFRPRGLLGPPAEASQGVRQARHKAAVARKRRQAAQGGHQATTAWWVAPFSRKPSVRTCTP